MKRKKLKQGMKKDTDKKKAMFLEYYRKLPIIKLACGYCGVCQDTATDWLRKDKVFSDAVEKAKSDFAEENVHGVKNREWLLERIMNEHFRQITQVDSGVTSELTNALDRMAKVLKPSKE